VERIARGYGLPVPELDADTRAALRRYAWPGNIRELRNVVERAVLLCTGHAIEREHLPEDPPTSTPLRAISAPLLPVNDVLPLPDPADDSERSRIIRALNACAGNQTQAAKRLGMPRRTFVAKLDLYKIPRPKKRVDDLDD
jgi:DNA-binding NtrC family response regulator